MTDLLHTHITIGIKLSCPACIQTLTVFVPKDLSGYAVKGLSSEERADLLDALTKI
jgi:hypothetical protein